VSALIRWLPKLAVASADDIAQFGPQAARVRTLLDFLPTMSQEAARVGGRAWLGSSEDLVFDAVEAASRAGKNKAYNASYEASRYKARYPKSDMMSDAARSAGWGEAVSDLISPENYRILTNPLATGRAAPRYKDTPFRELLQELAPKRLITQPSDVLSVGRIARSPEDIVEIAMTLIADGVPIDEAYQMARLV
jgi:hypothetical protein